MPMSPVPTLPHVPSPMPNLVSFTYCPIPSLLFPYNYLISQLFYCSAVPVTDLLQ